MKAKNYIGNDKRLRNLRLAKKIHNSIKSITSKPLEEMSIAGVAGIAMPANVLRKEFPTTMENTSELSNKYRTVFSNKVDVTPVIVESFKSERLNKKSRDKAIKITELKKKLEELESDNEIIDKKKDNYYKRLRLKQEIKSAKMEQKANKKIGKNRDTKFKKVNVKKQPKNVKVKVSKK